MADTPTLSPSLQEVQGEELESYVRSRIRHFARRFATRINPLADTNAVDKVLEDVLEEESEPIPEIKKAEVKQEKEEERANPSYKLQFFHVCQNLGCRTPNCQLCKNNPDVVCDKDFAKSYYIGEHGKFTSACRANISLRLTHEGSGEVAALREDLTIELWALEGNYKGEDLEAHLAQGEKPSESFMTLGKVNQPIRLTMLAGECSVELPVELTFTRGSEKLDAKSVMLCARATGDPAVPIKEACSDTFRVLSRRSRLSLKPDRPSMEASVKNLCCVGEKTFEKLKSLQEECAKQKLNLDFSEISEGSGITTINEFCRMSTLVEKDPVLKEKMLKLLGMTEENWAEANRHASAAVVQDNTNRVWINGHVSLVYECILGKVELNAPKQIWCEGNVYQPDHMDSSEWSSWFYHHDCARKCWFQAGHPGWRRANQLLPSQNSAVSLNEFANPDTVEIPFPELFPDEDQVLEGLFQNFSMEGACS